jgi:hypothetical protein
MHSQAPYAKSCAYSFSRLRDHQTTDLQDKHHDLALQMPTNCGTRATLAWDFASSSNAVDGTPARYNDCPLRIPKTAIFECATEFFYERPDGTDGTRWFFASGAVQWVHVQCHDQ